jgi:hypothetical protein
MLLGVEGLRDNARKRSHSPKMGTGAASYKTFPLFAVIYEGMPQSVQAKVTVFLSSD